MNIFDFYFSILNMSCGLTALAGGLIMAGSCPKRKYYVLRLILALLVVGCVSGFSSHINVSDYVVNMTMNYTLLAVLGMTGTYFCYDVSLPSAIYLGSSSYIIRHCVYSLVQILILIIDACTDNFFFTGDYWNWSFVLLHFLTIPVYILMHRYIKKNPILTTPRGFVFLFSIIAIIITIVMNIYVPLGYVTQYTNVTRNIVFISFSLLCSLFSLIIMFGYSKLKNTQEENTAIRQMLVQQNKQFQVSKQNVEYINMKCHDLRHRIRNLEEICAPELKDELESIKEGLRIYDTRVKTGNVSLDLVLREKSLICKKNNIVLNCLINGELLDFMEESDVYSLFENILDNAINSVTAIENENKRIITIKIREATHGGVFCYCENPYLGKINFDHSLPQSQEGTKDHGYGMKSIQYIVNKYNGILNIKAKDNIFAISIFFLLNK